MPTYVYMCIYTHIYIYMACEIQGCLWTHVHVYSASEYMNVLEFDFYFDPKPPFIAFINKSASK